MEEEKEEKKCYRVPKKFKPILIDLIKNILIHKPEDIITFSLNYFTKKQEEIQISVINRATTYPLMITPPPPNKESKNLLSLNPKNYVKQKSNCKKETTQNIIDKIDNTHHPEAENGACLDESLLFECINFEEKEEVLNSIKDNDNSLKEKATLYYNNKYLPYKNYKN